MGGRRQDRSIGYATATVKGEELARTNTVSPANALQGKVAGVQIATGGSAGVTTSPSVQIRGAKSLSKNNSPIYVIDGIVMMYEESNATGNNNAVKFGNQLKNMNPDDYENITVLKGAAATSLYGSRGANGAIVITTKKGTSRQGIGVEVNMSHEWSNIYANSIPLQNEYGMGQPTNGFEGGMMDAGVNSTATSYTGASWGPSFASMQGVDMYQYYKYYAPAGEAAISNPLEAYQSYPDNWKAFYQNSMYNSVTVALTGGSEKATFRLSYGYTDSDGNMPNNSFDRHSINFSTTGQLNDIISTNLTLQYSNSNTLNAGHSDNNAWGTVAGFMMGGTVNRSTDLQWYKDHYIDPDTYKRYGFTAARFNEINSKIDVIADNNVNRNEQMIIAQLGISAQFTDWLDASVSVSYNNLQTFTETKNYGAAEFRQGGSYGVEGGSSSGYQGLATIHSNNSFLDDNLTMDIRVFSEIYGNAVSNSYSRSANGLKLPGVFSFANTLHPMTANNQNGNIGYRNDMTIGVGAAAIFGWKDQLYLDITARNDWMSSLLYPKWLPTGQDNYSVFYPSASLSWIFSDTFQIDSKILSYGQLRASFAQVGMGTGAYVTDDGAGGFATSNPIGPQNVNISGVNPNNGFLPNLDLKPELQTSWEFGADLRFLEGRLGMDVAWYRTNTRNQILKVGAVVESGVSEQWINAGQIQNQGWELELDFVPIRTRTVNWTIGGNIYRNRTKIIELVDGMTSHNLSGWAVESLPHINSFVGGEYAVVTAGGSYGPNGEHARYQNKNNANDPNNGKRMMYVNGNDGNLNTTGTGGATNFATNSYYSYVRSKDINGYYSTYGIDPDTGKDYVSEYSGLVNPYTNYGTVQPDFSYGINTSVRVNLPNSSGSLDFFAQLDGRQGGTSIVGANRWSQMSGTSEATLYGRSAEHGGVSRINYKGDYESNGTVPDAIFYEGGTLEQRSVVSLKTGQSVDLGGMTFVEAMDAGHIQPVLSSYLQRHNASGTTDVQISEQSYLSLREITVGYNVPSKWIKFVGLQSARLSFTGRNLCYLYNGARDGANPDSFVNNNPMTPVDWGTTPFTRTFSFNLKLNF